MLNKTQKLLFTIQEVTSATSLGRTSVYNAISEGKLIAKKFGSKTLVTAESLDAFINALPMKESVGGGNV